jgi:hypothetical protein
MSQKYFGSAKLDYNGAFRNLSEKITVKVGDFFDEEDGKWYETEKNQPFSGTAMALRKEFTPEINLPLRALEGFNVYEIVNKRTVNLNVSFGGSTYSIVGGFVFSSGGLGIESDNGDLTGLTVTGGTFRIITA